MKRWSGFIPAAAVLLCITALAGCGKQEQISKTTIEKQVREILTLPTFEHVYHDIVYLGEESKFLGLKIKDKQVLFSIDVRVRGGIDFTEGVEININDDNSAVVRLPAAKILSVDADESTIKQYFVRDLGGGISALQYYDEINRNKEFLTADAISRGLLVRAGENARLLIRNMLELTGIEEIEFQTLPNRTTGESGDG